jgi:rhodanese-related sulfurtransferase
MKNILCMIVSLCTLGLVSLCVRVTDEELIEARKAAKKGATIVDVSTPVEFSAQHIKGAINLTLEDIIKDNIKLPKNKEVLVYCQTGSRSRMCASILRKKGWSVHDIASQREWERTIEV